MFRVRGRNVYGNAGDKYRLAFAILPPWYRACRVFYALIISGMIVVQIPRAAKFDQLIKIPNNNLNVGRRLICLN